MSRTWGSVIPPLPSPNATTTPPRPRPRRCGRMPRGGAWRLQRSSPHGPVGGGTAGSAGLGLQSSKFRPIERRTARSLRMAGTPGPQDRETLLRGVRLREAAGGRLHGEARARPRGGSRSRQPQGLAPDIGADASPPPGPDARQGRGTSPAGSTLRQAGTCSPASGGNANSRCGRSAKPGDRARAAARCRRRPRPRRGPSGRQDALKGKGSEGNPYGRRSPPRRPYALPGVLAAPQALTSRSRNRRRRIDGIRPHGSRGIAPLPARRTTSAKPPDRK